VSYLPDASFPSAATPDEPEPRGDDDAILLTISQTDVAPIAQASRSGSPQSTIVKSW
jgi:hypothetical protein